MSKYIVKDNRLFVKDDKDIKEIPAQVLYEFWKNPNKGNLPDDYVSGVDRTQKLISLFDKYCSKNDEILELGCNIGRNLHYLYRAGYKNLYGVDINQDALDKGKRLYPDTVAKLPLTCLPIEDAVLRISENEADVVFTMGVLMHLHPSSIWVFNHLKHIAKKHLITAEEETELCEHVFPRNYKQIFEHLGMKQVYEEYAEYPNTVDEAGVIKLQYRIFEK